ncbi:NAD(P)H-dependent oxidoreductase [Rubrivirga sp. S365]|uniref:NAD(P)H-dependent oxidoreductase n=1 Tax=Rubrivirga litoralis TaxID=3075598 RepID=A0ABU3BPF0_9BACT|nr:MULTISPECIES: NAD(P)H-dependent oxidoreductase [unclassified Rubrivirga]MDT0631166.1 NAD(P)H-dependent oxidoreductase [Rubrivirga sp. F394]MDT7856691.1 NAD(P)H-dependent oxidoreductase [Rubrivirga sp. S365]
MSAPSPTRVLGFAGSLRTGSYNRALLRAAQELAPEDMTIDVFDLRGVPLYNADVEAEGDPERVAALKEAIRAADGVLIVTPEYNHGVPAVTKNAVDWASRPPRSAPLGGKPVGIIGASPGMTGSARGQSQLRQAFEFTNSFCMPQPEVLVARAHEKFDADGRLTDETTRTYLGRYLVALAAWIDRLREPSGAND